MTTITSRDKAILWYFVGFFAIVLIVNIVMVTLAVRTNTGTVTDHPYEKGIAYNQVIQAEQSQEKLGWTADIKLKGDRLRVVLRDAKGEALTPDELRVRFSRPTQEGMDFDMPLKGREAQVHFPAKGLWEIRIFSRVGTHHYQKSQRVVVE